MSPPSLPTKDSVLGTALVPLQYPTGRGAETAVEFAVNPAHFHSAFAADLAAGQAAIMAATQRPVAELAFSEPSGVPAWKALPAWQWLLPATGRPGAMSSVPWPGVPGRPSPRSRAPT